MLLLLLLLLLFVFAVGCCCGCCRAEAGPDPSPLTYGVRVDDHVLGVDEDVPALELPGLDGQQEEVELGVAEVRHLPELHPDEGRGEGLGQDHLVAGDEVVRLPLLHVCVCKQTGEEVMYVFFLGGGEKGGGTHCPTGPLNFVTKIVTFM